MLLHHILWNTECRVHERIQKTETCINFDLKMPENKKRIWSSADQMWVTLAVITLTASSTFNHRKTRKYNAIYGSIVKKFRTIIGLLIVCLFHCKTHFYGWNDKRIVILYLFICSQNWKFSFVSRHYTVGNEIIAWHLERNQFDARSKARAQFKDILFNTKITVFTSKS